FNFNNQWLGLCRVGNRRNFGWSKFLGPLCDKLGRLQRELLKLVQLFHGARKCRQADHQEQYHFVSILFAAMTRVIHWIVPEVLEPGAVSSEVTSSNHPRPFCVAL